MKDTVKNSKAFVRIPRAPVRECSLIVPPELEAWLSAFRRTAVGAASRAKSAALSCNSKNISLLTRYCMRWYKAHPCSALPNDKEPGFTVIHAPVLRRLHEEVLKSNFYQEVSTTELAPERWKEEYGKLCTRVAKAAEQPHLASDLFRSSGICGARASAALILNAKTHKSSAEFRNVHAGGSSVFAGLGIWLCRELQSVVDEWDHLLPSCSAFSEWARTIEIRPGDYMVRVDVKHFFMSGQPSVIANLASSLLPIQKRRVYEDALLWLLHNQFVESEYLPGRAFRVCRGTGMGLQFSGPAADLAFLAKCEIDFALRLGTRCAHGVRHYKRFKDDIFIIASDHTGTRQWYRSLQRAAAPVFELQVEEVSNIEVTMLSMLVTINGIRLETRPKPQPMAMALGHGSGHHHSVHSKWPRAYLRNLAQLCSNRDYIWPACTEFVARMKRSGAPAELLDDLHGRIQGVVDAWPNFAPTGPRQRRDGLVWLILKHHPSLRASGFARAVRQFLQDPFWASTAQILKFEDLVRVGVGYANPSRHFYVQARNTRAVHDCIFPRGGI